LVARDRWLAPGGLLLPSACHLCVSASTHDRLAFWKDVYGFSMHQMADACRKEASVEVVPAASLISGSCVVKDLDLTSIQEQELDFNVDFQLPIELDGDVACLVVHFDTLFGLSAAGGTDSSFSTCCTTTPTHWKQTALYLKRPRAARAGDVLTGTLSLVRAKEYRRGYDISVSHRLNDGEIAWQLFHLI